MRTTALALLLVSSLHIHAADSEPAPVKPAAPPAPAAPADPKAQALCTYLRTCIKAHPGKPAYCVKTGMKESGLLDHVLGGDQAKDLSRFLRHEGFVDKEFGLKDFNKLPDGAVLVLDAHDPVRDRKPACPKVYGNVLVKCEGKWLDDQVNDLDFHMKRGCRTKGIWVHPSLMVPEPEKRGRS